MSKSVTTNKSETHYQTNIQSRTLVNEFRKKMNLIYYI